MITLPAYYLGAIVLLLLLMGFLVAAIMPGIERWSRLYFTSYYLVLMLCTGAYIVDLLTYKNPDLIVINKLAIHLEYLSISFPMPMLTAYLLHCCGESWKHSKAFYTVFALWCIYLLFIEAAQFTTCFYYITPDGRFCRGPLHLLLCIPLIAIRLINLATLIHRRRMLSRKYYYAFLIYLVPMTIAIIVHTYVFVIQYIAISICLCSFTMYIIILTDQIEQYMRQQREIASQQQKIALQQQEIARQRTSVMVLQMRPHFIFNTMMSIYSLCNQDPGKARQVILDFTTYLRKNFTGIASERMILFAEELEHTRAYLAVEQAQFEENLFVDYDTPFTLFRVPPLTLQPIVENAVKHGLDPCSSPLHILIQTRDTDSGAELIIKDDGPGFEASDNSEPHIALMNIHQRLELMCSGKMEITSSKKAGTIVKITIPPALQPDR